MNSAPSATEFAALKSLKGQCLSPQHTSVPCRAHLKRQVKCECVTAAPVLLRGWRRLRAESVRGVF